MTFKSMRAHIKSKLKGATSAQLRTLTYMRMKAAAAACCLAYEQANEHARQAYEKIIQDWREQVEVCASDPSYAASTDARTMSAEEASYFSKIADGIYWSFLCRKKKCMFFGGNNVETWVKHKGHGWFRCPMCGYRHRPCATDDLTDVQAKWVLTLTCPMTGNLLHIPCENPASQDDRWINNMIEVAARDIKTEADVQQWWSKARGDVQEWLTREGRALARHSCGWSTTRTSMTQLSTRARSTTPCKSSAATSWDCA